MSERHVMSRRSYFNRSIVVLYKTGEVLFVSYGISFTMTNISTIKVIELVKLL